MIKKFVMLLAVFALCSCTSIHGPGSAIDHKSDIRQVRLIVYQGGWFSESSLRSMIQDTSDQWEEQFGIQLVVKKVVPINWEHFAFGYVEVVRQMLVVAREETDFDIAVGFYRRNPAEALIDLIYGWAGCIDDRWRQYIVLKSADSITLSHELAHAFVLSEAHEINPTSLLTPMQFPIVPGTPFVLKGTYVTDEVYEEVMRNKWRTFGEVVDERVTEEILGL